MFLRSLLLAVTVVFFAACATHEARLNIPLVSESDYHSLLDARSKETSTYDGFYNTLEYRVSVLDQALTLAQVDHSARIYQWDQTTYDSERQKALQSLNNHTYLFLSFFVPERKHDNLAKARSMWKIFIEFNGRRFEGKASRDKRQLAEIRSYYPDHNRWTTPYLIEFPVPTYEVEGQKVKFTITGPVVSAPVELQMPTRNTEVAL